MNTEACQERTSPLSCVEPPIHIFLALQGGGALGAFEVGVLDHLHNGLGVGEQIRALSGVSFGGINAAIYVANYRKNPIGALKQFWNAVTFADSPLYPRILPFVQDTPLESWVYDLSLPAQALAPFLNLNFYRMRMDGWNAANWIYLLDNSPLKPLLTKLIDVDELNSPLNPQLILTSVNIETGDLSQFDNRKQRLSIDHVLASASLPPAFRPTEIDRQRYWDGALFDNSPFMTLLRALRDEDIYETPATQSEDVDLLKVLTSPLTKKRLITVELFPREGDFPRSLFEAFGRIIELNNRVKITKQSIGNLYEYAVFINWLHRYFRNLAGIAGGDLSSSDRTDFARLRKKNLKQALLEPRAPWNLSPEEADARLDAAIALSQCDAAFCAQQALLDYFNEPRPDPRYTSRESSEVVSTRAQTRADAINLVGIVPESLYAINEFATLIAEGIPASPISRQSSVMLLGLLGQSQGLDFSEFIKQLVGSQLVKNQVARFANIELFPLRTTVLSGLLTINDFSSGGIRSRYEAGLKAAQEQVFVADFPAIDAAGMHTKARDLMFVAHVD